MAQAGRSGGAAPRLPGLLNVAAVGVVVSMVAAVALTARQEPPPTVAEFAPQAVEQIEEALPEQAEAPDGTVGAAGGAGPGPDDPAEEPPEEPERETPPDEEPADGATPARSEAPEIEEPRVRRCVGDPPRQTEDPQSPPCVAYFEGDNGGATSKGVTKNEIRVAVPLQLFGGAPVDMIEDLVDHFNRRYEFYGRQIVIETYEPTGGTFAHPNPQQMQADAVKVAEEIQAFASIAYPDRKGSEHHHYDALAERGVISSAYRAQSIATNDRYRRTAPYQWNAMPGVDVMLTALGDAVCNTMAGMPPQGGGPQGDGDQSGALADPVDRVFGLAVLRNTDGSIPPIDILSGRLSSCDASLAVTVEDDAANPNANNVVGQMRDAGVTSVIYLGDPGVLRANYMEAAQNQVYFPEWVVSSFIDMDVDNVFQPGSAPPTQSRNVLGVTFRDKLLPRQQMPWYWAIRESSPAKDPSGGLYYPVMATYRQLLQLASGIQLAGPNLTPETFAEGLHKATFPNPRAGRAPAFQAAVSYQGRYIASDTGALYFYDPQASGTVDPGVPGAVCYVDNGRRYAPGGYPKGPKPFFGRCR